MRVSFLVEFFNKVPQVIGGFVFVKFMISLIEFLHELGTHVLIIYESFVEVGFDLLSELFQRLQRVFVHA